MPLSWYCLSTSRIDSRVAPTQDRWGAASWPAAWISRTVARAPCCVLPPAPKVTEKYFGFSSASLARAMRSFSAPSGVLGGKNSILKSGVSIFVGEKQGRKCPRNDAVQDGCQEGGPESGDFETVDHI